MTPPTMTQPVLMPRAHAASPQKTLRRLFFTLFLRGRGSRGLQKEAAPKSVGHKLAMTLLFYGLFGLFAFFFSRQSVFALSVYLHSMTFVFWACSWRRRAKSCSTRKRRTSCCIGPSLRENYCGQRLA